MFLRLVDSSLRPWISPALTAWLWSQVSPKMGPRLRRLPAALRDEGRHTRPSL